MKIINPATLAEPRGYNNGVLFETGRVLFVAGQIGWDKTGKLAAGLASQFEQALKNVVDVVQAAGGSPENIGRFTIYIKDKQDYIRNRHNIGEVYKRIMGKHFPAMSLLIIQDLLEEGALVEIEATAVL
jgi:enamine deaminase RidA (YjgF/YER057c/UK114 family)